MPQLNLDYDHFTLSAMLRACAGLSAIELGRQVHAYLIRKVYDVGSDVFLQSTLSEMYGKCGLVAKVFQVFSLLGLSFEGQKKRDVVLWSSMLGVYGRNGYFEEVILLYKEMLKEKIKPDEVAFVTVISACSHTGQVKLGIEYFESMTRGYKLVPGPEHYSCLVDLLRRTGKLDKAWEVVNEMLQKGHDNGSISMWCTLLSACVDLGNIELGKFAAQKALELDPQNAGIYVLLSNLYAKFGRWDEFGQLREMMKHGGLKKDAGCSWIEKKLRDAEISLPIVYGNAAFWLWEKGEWQSRKWKVYFHGARNKDLDVVIKLAVFSCIQVSITPRELWSPNHLNYGIRMG
ncbi:hypothetical protein SLEP1_g33730 [Rubroshorea leprosula]|uniref:Pentatricopeptide repeat-containing protein n=1 Tax=Rubroshorea leprosula TaxID=152421 RepID=A0AAV5KHK8_9ROSI|nr:hypothetical protein SLEP1_g33730 [Rubroshorea leprosula]